MDKELALVIAEMLIKQDETTAQVKDVVVNLKETNNILRDFMAISVKQWEEQHTFNQTIVYELKGIKETITTALQLETRLKAIEERENKFEVRLANIERVLKAS